MSLEVNIKKKFKGFSLEVSLIHEGGCLGILGASGSGKSMTLKCIAGIEKPDEGRIILEDKVLFDSSCNINMNPQNRKIGYLFQNYALFPNMTVSENIGVGIHLPKKEKVSHIAGYLERFHLQELGGRYPNELSGGQQQRVALARIMAYSPDMILLDEPFSALDSNLRDCLQWELIDLLRDYKGIVILVSHSRDEIYRFSERLCIIHSGKQLLNGNTKDIFHNPKLKEVARLTGCKNISPIKKLSEYELVALDWGIKLHTAIPIEEHIRYVGIRAHSLQPCNSILEENSIRVQCKGFSETVTEYEYLLTNSDEVSGKEICWRVAKKDNTEKSNTEKSNTEKINTEKNNIEKNNTEKNNTEENNTEKDITKKNNTEKDITKKDNIEKDNTKKVNIEKDNMAKNHMNIIPNRIVMPKKELLLLE